jgi:hypothetical protein
LRSILISIVLILMAIQARADLPVHSEAWRLDFDNDGIRIYTKVQTDSVYHAFKAETLLNVPLKDVMAVMAQPGSCVEWVHGCVESWGLKEESFNKRYAYSVNDLPWPVRDRDYVLEINTSNDPAQNTIMMDMYAVTDEMPPKDGLVRVSRQETHYILTSVGENQTRMIWLQHTDPAGALPSWLVNALIVDIPFKSMKALEQVAKSPKYTNSEIIYDDSGKITGVKKSALARGSNP